MGTSLPRVTLLHTEARDFPSTIMGVNYQVSIGLPPSYSSGNRQYPVIYLLDGELFFGVVNGIVSGLVWGQVIPECLVVGVGHDIQNIREWWQKRSVDLNPPANPEIDYPEWMAPYPTRRAPDFLQFLKHELIPFIETTYRADPAARCLTGYSLGAQFSIYSLFHEPALFQKYIIGSGFWLHMLPEYAGYIERFVQQKVALPISAFFSVCALEDDQYPFFQQFLDLLDNHPMDGFNYQSLVLEGENHSSGMAPAFTRGFRALLSSK